MNGPIVDARGLHKHFGALHVLKGVDLRVAGRELVFVIGPSGSGKSTLLRCLNRLEEPSSGSIVVDGIDMLDPRIDINHARQRIGMVFQSLDRKSTRLNSSHVSISYAVFCLKKKKKENTTYPKNNNT